MAQQWIGEWKGGRTYVNARGETVYVIRRQHQNRRLELALLDASGNPLAEDKANVELTRFEEELLDYRTPYQRARDVRKAKEESARQARVQAVAKQRADDQRAVFIEEATLDKYRSDPDLGIGKRTHRYQNDVIRYLAAWGEKLYGRDLRKVTPIEVDEILDGWGKRVIKDSKKLIVIPGKQKRIAAIKAFCSYLRSKHLLDASNDPSRDLKVPQSQPEKDRRLKGYDMTTVERIYGAVPYQDVRDALGMAAKLGVHETEIERIASDPMTEVVELEHPEIAGTVMFWHKNSKWHRVSVDRQTLEAVKRLRATGHAPAENRIRWVLGVVCEQLGVLQDRQRRGSSNRKVSKRPKGMNLSELRHSIWDWGQQHGELITFGGKGVGPDGIAGVLGHSVTTGRKHYDVSVIPAMLKLPLKLEHPEDPRPINGAAQGSSPATLQR